MALKNSYNTDGRMGVLPLDTVDTTPQWKLGDDLEWATDWGVVECLYLQAGAGGVVAGNLCMNDNSIATAVSPTADATKPLCVALNSMSVGQYGWFAVKGTVPVASATTTTVGARVFLAGTAGQTTSATTVGKAILNAVYAEAVTITSGYKLALATIQHPTQEAPNA